MSSDPVPENSKPQPGQISPYLHIDGVGPFKWSWVKAANRKQLSLSEWVITELNAAADRQNREEGQKRPQI